mmetsp:Transcript_17891/g.54488  ORF Transcript_17891/g.54488 Transcript_17891/m.54488 type:complete len:153 (-) Transcript_17891:154-612(-)
MKEPRSSPRATRGRVDAAQLCLERGADINQALKWPRGMTPQKIARDRGHMAMTAWLALIRDLGWARYDVAATRYKLVVLRAAAARGRARRQHAFYGKELVLDFLFPSDQSPLDQPHLPDELFSIIARFWWGGGWSAKEEIAAAVEAEESDSE